METARQLDRDVYKRQDYRNGGKRHVAYCSEYHKGKAKNPKCHSPHIIDADLLMQTCLLYTSRCV